MCNIIALKAGVSIPYEKLETCTYNNPHGFGLILRDPSTKKLQIIRRCPKENDPKEIFDLLEDNKDIERYLHLRWRTDGPINLENTHPFPAYSSNNREIYFMHNGVLSDFKPRSVYENGVQKTLEGDTSDSKKFNDEFLAPYLLTHVGANGKADYHDPMFIKIINKFWSSGSKGLLISNDLEPLFINEKEWKELDFGGGKFWSSNDTYWNRLTRGPEYDRREAEAKQKREKEAAARAANRFQEENKNPMGGSITNLRDITLKPKEVLSEDLANIFEDYNIWTDEGTAALSNLTQIEIEDLIKKDAETAAALLIHITSAFDELYKRKERMVSYIKKFKKTGQLVIDNSDQKELDLA